MRVTALILNLPWSIFGLLIALISLPKNVKLNPKELVLTVKVKWLWLSSLIINRKVRGLTMGNVIMISNASINATFNHEMTHIKQFQKVPLLFPLLYCVEFMKSGYRQDEYEKEAYKR